tara:strand:- start:557 stop:730 length:174 start_codon:yes stop_codon:yes gene_type:complete
MTNTFASIIIADAAGNTLFTTCELSFAHEFLAENMLLTVGKGTFCDEEGEHLVINTI